MATLSSLPPEISREVLRYLPVRALLDFGLTSKNNHALQSCSLSKLRLGVFHYRLSGIVSLMEATVDRSYLHSVQKILPKDESRTKEKVIHNQNIRIRKVIDGYQQSLRDLEVALWELNDSTAHSIAQLKNLKRLSIRLDHPHTRFPGIDRQFWESSPGSTIWNNLASKPGKMTLGRLQSLNLERAGITDYQLAKVLESNPLLKEIRLRKYLTLTSKTFKMIAESNIGRHIEILCFTKSDNDQVDDRMLEYIVQLPNLKVLSLHGCNNIDSNLVKKLNDEQWHIPDLTLPRSPVALKKVLRLTQSTSSEAVNQPLTLILSPVALWLGLKILHL